MPEPADRLAAFRDRPNRGPWPPAAFVFCLCLGYGLSSAYDLPIPAVAPWRALGAVLIGLGLMLIVWASATLARARTTILPHHASERLVTGGPFAFSRNPIYLGEALILAGLGGIEASLWHPIAAITFVNLVALLGVVREEAHLEARFGDAWRSYAARVRRWI